MKYRRIFVIVMDSLGIGCMEDAARFGDEGADTFGHISETVDSLSIPNLAGLGMLNLHKIRQYPELVDFKGYQMALNEASNGKDTMTGHWEMMGIRTDKPFITFTDTGFP